MSAYGGVDVWIHFYLPRHWLEVTGQLHAPAALPPGEKARGTLWIVDWVRYQSWPGRFEDKMTLAGLELRPLGRSAHSQPLYRLRYRYLEQRRM
jgi:hypothetical protein